MPGERAEGAPPGQALDGRSLAIVAGVFWCGLLASQVMVPALRGWQAGIGNVIAHTEKLGAFLSQLAVVMGTGLAFLLLMRALRDSRLGIGFRIGIAPLTAALITTVMAAVVGPLAPLMSLVLSLMAACIAIASSWPAMARPRTRGLGLCLGLVGTASTFGAAARLLALRASSDALTSLFAVARVLATVSLVASVAAWVVVGLWLAQRRWGKLLWVFGAPLGLGIPAALAAITSAETTSPTAVLVSRMVLEFSRHPQPLLSDLSRYSLDGTLFVASAVVLFAKGRPLLARAAACLVLMPRGATDIPLLALALVLASLAGALHAASDAPAP